jgi:hypothetical protein
MSVALDIDQQMVALQKALSDSLSRQVPKVNQYLYDLVTPDEAALARWAAYKADSSKLAGLQWFNKVIDAIASAIPIAGQVYQGVMQIVEAATHYREITAATKAKIDRDVPPWELPNHGVTKEDVLHFILVQAPHYRGFSSIGFKPEKYGPFGIRYESPYDYRLDDAKYQEFKDHIDNLLFLIHKVRGFEPDSPNWLRLQDEVDLTQLVGHPKEDEESLQAAIRATGGRLRSTLTANPLDYFPTIMEVAEMPLDRRVRARILREGLPERGTPVPGVYDPGELARWLKANGVTIQEVLAHGSVIRDPDLFSQAQVAATPPDLGPSAPSPGGANLGILLGLVGAAGGLGLVLLVLLLRARSRAKPDPQKKKREVS